MAEPSDIILPEDEAVFRWLNDTGEGESMSGYDGIEWAAQEIHLRNCPFCGEQAHYSRDSIGWFTLGCVNNCPGNYMEHSKPPELLPEMAGLWNRRAEPAPENGGVWLSAEETEGVLSQMEYLKEDGWDFSPEGQDLYDRLLTRTSQMQEGQDG